MLNSLTFKLRGLRFFDEEKNKFSFIEMNKNTWLQVGKRLHYGCN